MVTQTKPISAVRTTGIYCRDGCSATPLRRNTMHYPSGVAAEAAGYRPCLRCRPDRLPAAISGNGVALVERALLLIAEGALDDETEDALAGQLGVTARHLRRIFEDHVGATPAFVARSRRAHFARRLLDESDLPVLDIAYAAGFASVRQMNRVMQSVFRFSPRELRAKRRDADRLVADGGLCLRMPYASPFSFDDMLAYLRPRAIPGVEHVGDRAYHRTISAHGDPGAIEISDAGDGRHLLVVAHLPTMQSLIDDVARCRRVFGLDRHPAGGTPLADDSMLRGLVAARPGLRVPGAWDPFEVSIRILLGQQISVPAATTLAGRLVQSLGTPVRGLGALSLTHLIPPATRIAEASLDRLRKIGLPEARAESIRAFARAYAADRLRFDAAVELPAILDALQELPGVGPWTAHMIALRAAGQPDAFPAGDLGLRRAAARLTGRDTVSAAELEELSEAWRPHRSLAAMHLWAS
ncbi:MAG: AlkA N-terminal domain-containing protein [Dehalococcoidia bacterium]